MWDVNPQAHKFHLQNVERQFIASSRGQSAGDHLSLSRLAKTFRRMTHAGVRNAVAMFAICTIGLIFLV